jgi:hypothetical protein
MVVNTTVHSIKHWLFTMSVPLVLFPTLIRGDFNACIKKELSAVKIRNIVLQYDQANFSSIPVTYLLLSVTFSDYFMLINKSKTDFFEGLRLTH